MWSARWLSDPSLHIPAQSSQYYPSDIKIPVFKGLLEHLEAIKRYRDKFLEEGGIYHETISSFTFL